MKSSFRSLALALLSLGLLGILGCAEDNEASVREQASKTKGEAGSTEAPPANQQEYFERLKQQDMSKKGGDYQTKKSSKSSAKK